MWNSFFVGDRKTVRFTVFCCCCCFDKRDLIYNISGGKINQYNQLWLVILLLSFFFLFHNSRVIKPSYVYVCDVTKTELLTRESFPL